MDHSDQTTTPSSHLPVTDLDLNLPLTHQLLVEGIDAGLHPGAQIYVSLNGDIVADDGIGESRPGVAMDRDTINLWMSATKPITAILFAQLWERDLIALDTPVSEAIPEFAQAGKSDITYRHLLTHTGGFRSEPEALSDLDWEDAIAQICGLELEEHWEPGERAGYHPATSWYILAESLSRIAGSPFADLLRTSILDPLGMEDTWIGIPVDQQEAYGDRIGWMYKTRRTVGPDDTLNDATAISGNRPGGNGRGPIRELARFYEALLEGGRSVVKPQTIERFTSRQRVGLFDHTFQHYMDWGFGFMLNSNRYGASTVPYSFGLHASPETFGHGGSQSSHAFADPEHNLVVALVCNGMPGEPRHNKRARELHTAIYEDLGLAPSS